MESLIRTQILSVSCGWQHTLALSSLGRSFSWGYGEDGQLGHGDTNDYLQPKEVEFFRDKGVVMIGAGHSHSGAITENGELYMWGCNPDCRLMVEDNENRILPSLTLFSSMRTHALQKHRVTDPTEPCYLSLGVTHTAVITRNGEVYTGGSRVDGQLGTGESMGNTMDNSFLSQVIMSRD